MEPELQPSGFTSCVLICVWSSACTALYYWYDENFLWPCWCQSAPCVSVWYMVGCDKKRKTWVQADQGQTHLLCWFCKVFKSDRLQPRMCFCILKCQLVARQVRSLYTANISPSHIRTYLVLILFWQKVEMSEHGQFLCFSGLTNSTPVSYITQAPITLLLPDHERLSTGHWPCTC